MNRFTEFFTGVIIVLVFIGYLLLGGCAKSSPVDTITDGQIGHIDDVLDYAYNNLKQDPEIVMLENELKSCQLGMESIRQSCNAQISTEKANTSYWRLACVGLAFALAGAIFALIKRWFK